MAGTFSKSLFKPSVVRNLERGSSRVTNVTLAQGQDNSTEGFTFSSGTFRYDPAGMAIKNVQQLNLDFSKFENHTFFNSAAAKTQAAFEKIINQFPFDGSKKDLIQFRDRISGYDNYVFESFPKNTGFLHFVGVSTPGNFEQGNYLTIKDFQGASADLSTAGTGASILDPTGKNFTVEFHLYVPTGSVGKNAVIFQRLGEDTTAGAKSKHFGITLGLQEFTALSTTATVKAIVSSGSFAIQTSADVRRGEWNHVAAVFGSNNEQRIELYRDSILISSSTVGSFDTGNVIAPITIGTGSKHEAFEVLFNPEQTLSGALDELRFWHQPRTKKQIRAFQMSNVFKEDDLMLYFRFNEPSGSFGSANSNLVLDHSGNGFHTKVNDFDQARREPRELPNPVSTENPNNSPVLFPSFSTVVSLNEALMTTASNYDYNNPNIITKLIPKHYLQEASNFEGFSEDIGDINKAYGFSSDNPKGGKPGSPQILAALLYSMAANMDELKLFVSEFGRLLKIDVKDDRTISDQFVPFLAKYHGLNLPSAFKDASIQQLKDSDGLNFNAVRSNLNLQKIQNTIWRRILTDLPELTRSKGTRHSIEALLRNMGIRPNSLFRIREYGGSRRKNISDTFEKRTEVASMLDFSGSLATAGVSATVDSNGVNSQRPLLRSAYLMATRSEPGIPNIDGGYDSSGVATNGANGLLTSGSFSAEGIYKFSGDSHMIKQSLMRLQTTGSVSGNPLSPVTNLLYNVVAVPPVSGTNTTGSIFLYGNPHSAAPATSLRIILTGTNVFDGEKWHVSFGRTRGDFNNSLATSSYYLRAGKMSAGRLSSYASALEAYADGLGHALQKTGSILNASGSYIAIGSQSLLYDATHTGYLNNSSFADSREANFSGKLCGIRFYSKALTEGETINHIKNFKSIGTNNPLINFSFNTADSGTFERLRADINIDQPTTKSNASGEISLFDFSQNLFHAQGTGFEANKEVIKPERFDYEILSPRFELATSTNKVRIRSWQSENNIKTYGGSLAPMYEIPQEEEPSDDRRLSIDISSVQAVNEDIVNILATLEFFEDAITAPELVFSHEYRDLRNLRRIYFNRLENKVSMEKFFNFYKWFDDTVGDIIEEFLPSSTNYLGTNFIVESHMLERAKFVYAYSDMYIGEIDRLEEGSIFLQQYLINLRKF